MANALSPARVVRVFINEEEKSARAVVPDHQLSLAIGREGQNARLAARLTGWKIDIKSESQMAELALLEAQRMLEMRSLAQVVEESEARRGRPGGGRRRGGGGARRRCGGCGRGGGARGRARRVEETGVAGPGVEEPAAEAAPEPEEPEQDLEIPEDLYDELEEGREKLRARGAQSEEGPGRQEGAADHHGRGGPRRGGALALAV